MSKTKRKRRYRWVVGITDPEGNEHKLVVDSPSKGNAEYQALMTVLSSGVFEKRPPRSKVRSVCMGPLKAEPVDPARGDW